MHRQGASFLIGGLNSIQSQTYTNIEVIVSDNSTNSDLESICRWHPLSSKIRYVRLTERYGGQFGVNLINAVKLARGDVVKILFQDDRFFLRDALARIAAAFINSKVNWIASGCIETPDFRQLKRVFFPSWNPRIAEGINSIGAPSVIAYRNGFNVDFDSRLTFMIDCDFYHRQSIKWGPAGFIMSPDVFIGIGDHQVTNRNVTPEIKERDMRIVRASKLV